jgi:glycine oxidase
LSESVKKPDVVIVGAGVIGAALALELVSRGARVLLLERGIALAQASSAAAGMLAAEDPHHPAPLAPLAAFSAKLYAPFLARVEELSGHAIPFQTERTQQYCEDGSSYTLAENSIDPRQLAAALRVALLNSDGLLVEHATRNPPAAAMVVHTTGAWSAWTTPVKGQMLRVQLAAGESLREVDRTQVDWAQDHRTQVHRTKDIYIVPRLFGPQAGTVLIGATLEHAGFDMVTHAGDLAALQSRACDVLPQLRDAAIVEAWAGLRPDTPDHLPLIGRVGDTREYIATGHFRNGILLAPATAVVVADLIEGKQPAVDLTPFAADRFVVRQGR